MRQITWLALIGLVLLGCDEEETYPAFEVYSAAFSYGEMIPLRHTCFGDNISPPLVFNDVPADVETYAIIMDDPDALGGTYTHWMIWGIPKEMMIIGEDFAEDATAEQNPDDWDHIHLGPNSGGDVGYSGPCPPEGEEHRYFFKVYALDSDLDLVPDDVETISDLKSAMDGRIVGLGELMGIYAD
jgi:hypothetical protein